MQQNKGEGRLSLTRTQTRTRTLTQVQQNKGEGKPPLAGAGLLLMGGGFMYVGSATYIQLYFHLRGPLRFARARQEAPRRGFLWAS